MKELSKKYDVPEDKLKNMMNDGVISCSWEGYEEVYYHYKELKKTQGTESAVIQTTVDKNISRRMVYNIIAKFE